MPKSVTRPNPYWLAPPVIKLYEALSALADNRLEIITPRIAKVWSSDRSKFYTIIYQDKRIRSNDNGSYWQGYLGYPAVALLLHQGYLDYQPKLAAYLGGINWKRLNQKYANHYQEAIKAVLDNLAQQAAPVDKLQKYISYLADQLKTSKIKKHPLRLPPPTNLTTSQQLLNKALTKLNQPTQTGLFA